VTHLRQEKHIENIDDYDLYAADREFNKDVKDCIGREIMAGATPEGAAAKAGVAIYKFRKWMDRSEMFRNFVMATIAERNSAKRKRINELIESSDDLTDKERIELLMKNLTSVDDDYGIKKSKVSVLDEKRTVAPSTPEQLQKELDQYRVVEEAERISDEA